MTAPRSARPVIFGEVLFDVFPDRAVLGGAPFNVACHLQGFGLGPLMITRVGRDARGRDVAGEMERRGMDMAGLQWDDAHPTGEVRVEMTGNEHTFEILPGSAWDHIDAHAARAAIGPADVGLFYYGSLAARSPVSSGALDTLLETIKAPFFVDINLRDPWWDPEHCTKLMRQANWLKLNEDELGRLHPGRTDTDHAALLDTYGLDGLVMTRDKDGAVLFTHASRHTARPEPVEDFVDSVGAGDAFASVVVAGILLGWEPPVTVRRAVEFAAEMCRHRGATLQGDAVYERFLARWRDKGGGTA
ncbi:MAG: carbohydrate kinase [Alphaproteobacteria bacterium]|nr:carbohydrate kinase [Alphaproteobacteria bacterium]